MKKLIWLLKLSHGVEIGAIKAYQGHWNSVIAIKERAKIRAIQFEELRHKEDIEEFLRDLGSKSNDFIDLSFEVIGTIMGTLCYFTGRRLPNLAAGMIEIMGVVNYKIVAKEATNCRKHTMATALLEMAKTEEEHRKYFLGKQNK